MAFGKMYVCDVYDIVCIYVYDIAFENSNEPLCNYFTTSKVVI